MNSFTSVVLSPLFTPLVVTCVASALIALYCWRAGSMHIVLDAIWKLTTGRADADDPIVRSLLRERLDVERFRLMYRLKVQNLDDVHKLARWAALSEISVGQLTKLGRWVDPTSREVVMKPPKRHARWQAIGIVVAASAALLSLQAVTSQQAWLRMKDSNVGFKSNGAAVSSPFDQWSFDESHCLSQRKDMEKVSGFTAVEVNSICAAFNERSFESFVAHTISFQRWTGVIAVVLSLALAANFTRAVSEARAAVSLREKLILKQRPLEKAPV